jgi:hypothetical protein
MRARLNPRFFGVRLGKPPEHAPDLNYKLAVHEPAPWPQSTSDADRIRRIVAVLERAGIRAFASGIEARPGGDESTATGGRRTRDGRSLGTSAA